MINTRTLGILLRSLDGADAGLGPQPASRVAAINAALAVGNRLDQTGSLLAANALAADVDVHQGAAMISAGLASDQSAVRATAGPQRSAVAGASPDVARAGESEPIDPQHLSPPDSSASLRLSGAAKLVDQLVQRISDADTPPAIRSTQPLVGEGSPMPEALARALQSFVAQSGLFYESHLAQWTLQQYPMSDLANEPQASLQQSAAVAQSPDTAADAASGSSQVASLSAGSQAAAALPLVRHQLDTLETRQVTWEGQVWPGQAAQIQIAEDEAGAGPRDQPTWRTRLALDLPTLGPVEATLSLHANTVQLRLHVTVPDSATPLRATQHDLVNALERRSLSLVAVTIDHE